MISFEYNASRPIRVLIVDDSKFIRQIFRDMLSSDPEIEVVGTAADPTIAREKIKSLNPDVITLDIEMPKMDGISFLEKIMSLRPMPVVMCSSLTQKGAEATFRALELGAVDYIAKTSQDNPEHIFLLKDELIAKVKLAATTRNMRHNRHLDTAPPVLSLESPCRRNLIAIGASTGGVEAIRVVLTQLPDNLSPIVITQHMPETFTQSFARRLDSLCTMRVHEAANDMPLHTGHAYIAPGNIHLEIVGSGTQLYTRLNHGAAVSGHRPSVDVMFESVAACAGRSAVAALLTGMGRDGAKGLHTLRTAGAYTIGESESSCIVYGMPRVAFESGAVMKQVPLAKVAQEILQGCTETNRHASTG